MELLQLEWIQNENIIIPHDDNNHLENTPLSHIPSFYDNMIPQQDYFDGSEWTFTMRKWWIKLLQTNNLNENILKLIKSNLSILMEDYFRSDFHASFSLPTLKKYFETEEDSDLTIATNGRTFHVHLSILNAHTEFFSTCLQDCWSESRENTVFLDCDPECCLYLLRYFYYGEIDSIPPSSLIPCITLSHQLLSHSLTSVLEKKIAPLIDSENVVSILNLADALGLAFLKERCLTLALKDLQNIQRLEYFQDLSPNARTALQELRRSYEQSKSLYGDTFHYIRELLSMIKDSIDEGEEAYHISKLRNVEEIEKCEEKLRRINLTYPLPADISLHYNYDRDLIEWRQRLQAVEENLEIQRNQLNKRKEFYQQQKYSLDIFYGSHL